MSDINYRSFCFNVNIYIFVVMIYFCDEHRHLVCKPYSVTNLHIMAKELNIKKCWFHKNHYDIPKKRFGEIINKCILVSPQEIVEIIKNTDIE